MHSPWYRRWSVLLAAVIVLAAGTAWLGWRGLQQAATPATTATTRPPATIPEPTSADSATTREPTTRPDPRVLWVQRGSDVHRSPAFEASGPWRIYWSFDCSRFSAAGGNFKLTGEGAFADVLIQEFDVKARGSRAVTSTGQGRLVIDSVCERWTVRAVTT